LEEPIAAALGANLPMLEPIASMVVDIGGGTSEMAIISMGGVVVSRSLKVAGDRLNDDIIKFIREDFHLAIGEATAERIKIEIGSALPMDERLEMNVGGRDIGTGLPREILIKSPQIRMAILSSLKQIVEAIRDTIEKTPPELSGDILRYGLYMSGGGSLLRGLPELVEKELSVKTVVVDDPLTCVVRGTGIAVENIDKHKDIFSSLIKPISVE